MSDMLEGIKNAGNFIRFFVKGDSGCTAIHFIWHYVDVKQNILLMLINMMEGTHKVT